MCSDSPNVCSLMDISTDTTVDFILDVNAIEDMEQVEQPHYSGRNECDIDETREQRHRRHDGAARDVNAITTVIMADASLVPPAFNGTSGTDAVSYTHLTLPTIYSV